MNREWLDPYDAVCRDTSPVATRRGLPDLWLTPIFVT
jgi:hypothetical protein